MIKKRQKRGKTFNIKNEWILEKGQVCLNVRLIYCNFFYNFIIFYVWNDFDWGWDISITLNFVNLFCLLKPLKYITHLMYSFWKIFDCKDNFVISNLFYMNTYIHNSTLTVLMCFEDVIWSTSISSWIWKNTTMWHFWYFPKKSKNL